MSMHAKPVGRPMAIDCLLLLFGFQLNPSTKCEQGLNKLFFLVNLINLSSCLGLIIFSWIQVRPTANQLIVACKIIFTLVVQSSLHRSHSSLSKLTCEIHSNIPMKRYRPLFRISILLILLVPVLIAVDLVKSAFILWLIGWSSYVDNFHPYLNYILPTESDLCIKIPIGFRIVQDSIITLSWFATSCLFYFYIYLSIKYLNQALLDYTTRTLINSKAGDMTNVIYATRKVYDMKTKFNSLLTMIPFIWLLLILVSINILIGDLLITPDREIEIVLLYNIVPIGLYIVTLSILLLSVFKLQRDDHVIMQRIIRLFCIESSRKDNQVKTEHLAAFLIEMSIFPTIKLTTCCCFRLDCGLIVKFVLIIGNCLLWWLIATPNGKVLLGLN